MEKDVTLIIPTYFSNEMLDNCLHSIWKNVENPKVLVYKNTCGWLQACNEAMQSTTDDVVLVNDDCVILTDMVKAMRELAYSDDKIGIVGGVSLMPNGSTVQNYGIYVNSSTGDTAHMNFGQQKDSLVNEPRKAVEGSLMLIKRSLIEDIGLFNPKYGMGYRAEVDYAFRAREKGWKVMACKDAHYIHYSSSTTSRLGIENDTHEIFMEDWSRKMKLGLI